MTLIRVLILLLTEDTHVQRPGDVRNLFFLARSCSTISFTGSCVRIFPLVNLGPEGDVLFLPGSQKMD